MRFRTTAATGTSASRRPRASSKASVTGKVSGKLAITAPHFEGSVRVASPSSIASLMSSFGTTEATVRGSRASPRACPVAGKSSTMRS